MGDLLNILLNGVLRILTRLVACIPEHRIHEMSPGWAWVIAASLTTGFLALIGAACSGAEWLFRVFVGFIIASLCLCCSGAFWPRSVRDG